ncbi:AAA family ATPase [Azospirillum sp. TSO22-1]|uniref:nucleotide-binding protein n=1 Tax=Azospirillum sp. TSO22-1 TaxID=716789 RepID=UPI000D658089|nr:AAA family ATPase [Azospirillum sp. TSO22-1]
MFTVLVANIKGGCGKTTVATHLAAAFAAAGHAAYLADADRQRSSLGWAARRPAGRPPVRALDWTREVGAPPPGIGRLVIDAPAALKGRQIEALVGMADVVVVPVLPGAFDEQATRRFFERLEPLKAVAKGRTPVVVVGNRVRVGTRASGRLGQFVAALGHPVAGSLRDSQFYGDAAAGGLSLFDLPGRRALAVRADWEPVLALVEAAASAPPAPPRATTAASAKPLVWRASDDGGSSGG